MRVRPEGYETTREYRHRKVREVRAAKQRNHDWGFAVLEALGRSLYEVGNPGTQPVELMRPHLMRSRGFRVVGVSAGWALSVFTPEDGSRPKRVTLLADGRWANGGWDRDERCLRVPRVDVRPIGERWPDAAFDETLVSSVEALELAHGFRITFPDFTP